MRFRSTWPHAAVLLVQGLLCAGMAEAQTSRPACALSLAGAAEPQQRAAVEARPAADRLADKSELRLLWLVHFPKELPSDYWPRMAGLCKAYGIQAVVPEVGTLAGYDRPRLKQAVEACHAQGVQVHAMVLSLYNWSVAKGQPARAVLKGDGTRAHDFVCPSNPANRGDLIRTARTMVTECAVDGYMFDYIRIGYLDGCYCDHCRRRFEQDMGLKVNWPADVKPGAARHKEFANWRISLITSLVSDVRKELLSVRGDLQLSAAVLSRNLWHRYGGAQDWVDWAAKGLLDFVCPMNYVNNVDALKEALLGDRTWIGEVTHLSGPEGPLPLVNGIGYGQPPPPPATVKALIDFGRANGADGFIYYDENASLGVEDYLRALSLPDVLTIRNVEVSPGRTTATITWATDKPGTSQVECAPGPLFQSTIVTRGAVREYARIVRSPAVRKMAADGKGTLRHRVVLTGLEAGKTYYYRVLSRDVSGQTGTAATRARAFKTEGAGSHD